MSITPGKREKTRIADLLEREWDSSLEAAEAVLELAWQMYEARARFVLVGAQVAVDSRPVPAEKGEILVFGPFATQTMAEAKIGTNGIRSTREQFNQWVAPLYANRTPADVLKERKAELDEQDRAEELRRLQWVFALNERARVAADLRAKAEGRLTLAELADRYPDSGYFPPAPDEVITAVPCPECGQELPAPELYAIPA